MGDTFREGIRVVRERSVLVAILSIVIYWSIRLFRSLDQTINTIWINQHVDSRVRATIFSMTGQADAFGLAVGGPILGAVGTVSYLSVQPWSLLERFCPQYYQFLFERYADTSKLLHCSKFVMRLRRGQNVLLRG